MKEKIYNLISEIAKQEPNIEDGNEIIAFV